MKIGVVIPWRSQPSRVPAFNAVVKWYEENLPDAKIYYADHPGDVWLPSASRNDGVRMAEADGVDVIVMSDADTIPQISPLKEAIQGAYEDNLIHNPYNRYRMLGDLGTSQHLEGNVALDKCSHTSWDSACSGTNVFTPAAWWKLGGMDEKFKQWGYEDTAMHVAHRIINRVDYVKHKGIAFAMGHAPQPKEGRNYWNNELLFNKYLKISNPKEMLAFVKSDSSEMQKISLNILVFVKRYLPETKAGAERMMHEVLLDLKKNGHNVVVVCEDPKVSEVDGIELIPVRSNLSQKLAWMDVMFTQLDYTKKAMEAASSVRKPLINFVHNDFTEKEFGIRKRNSRLIVANSIWIQNSLSGFVPTMIVNPPTNPEKYSGKTGEAITLINMSDKKGGEMFWQLARLLPDREFIGVIGSWGDQVSYHKELPNVTIYDKTDDIQSIYSKTGIVIMPSTYESWGKVAVEAMSFGIPVIASPTPGLKESIGEDGIFVNLNDVAGYIEAIKSLDDKDLYSQVSKRNKARAKELYELYKGRVEALELELIKIKMKSL
jgi:glycosyltransferase involved in cell wall biosynthesis